MSIVDDSKHSIIQRNMGRPLIDETTTGAGSTTRYFALPTTGLLTGLYATSITGTLTVTVSTYDGDTEAGAVDLMSFTLSAPTGQWVLKKADKCLNRIKVVCTYTGVCSYRVVARAIEDGHELTDTQVVQLVDPITAFGEIKTATITPTVQIDAIAGIRTMDVESETSGTGGVEVIHSATGHDFKVSTGATANSLGLMRSRRASTYRPGQGSVYRFSARFDAGVANSTLRAGAVARGNEFSFGYNGTQFGLLHRRGGCVEIRKLTLTVPAGGAETLTVKLNGVDTSVSVTAGTLKHNAYQIGAAAYTGWNAFHTDTHIIFVSTTTGPKAGAFSVTSTGALTGTFSTVVTGKTPTDTWVYQADWNVDPMDGTGPSQQVLNKQKGNVYEIQAQYLGYGVITYKVENPYTGSVVPVHRIRYPNAYESPLLYTTQMKMGLLAASTGSTTDIAVYSGSMMAGVEGVIITKRNPDGHDNAISGLSTTLTSVLSIRIRQHVNGHINLFETIPVAASAACEGTKPVVVKLMLNPVITGEPDWQLHQGDDTTNVETCVSTGLAITSSAPTTRDLGSYSLGKSGQLNISLQSLNIRLQPGDVLTVAMAATSGTSDVAAGLVWIED